MSNFILGDLDTKFKVGGDDCSIYLGTEKLYPIYNKFSATFTNGSFKIPCSDNTILTSGDTHSSQYTWNNLEDFKIGECVTEIDDSAFDSMPINMSNKYSGDTLDLRNVVTFGKTIFSIRNSSNRFKVGYILLRDAQVMKDAAFSPCQANFIIDNVTPPTWQLTWGLYPMSHDSIIYIYVPDSAVQTYKTDSNWGNFSDKIKGMSEINN